MNDLERLTWCRIGVFFNDTATTEIYTLSLHDALPICRTPSRMPCSVTIRFPPRRMGLDIRNQRMASEPSRSRDRKSTRLNSQSRQYLVCRLLLEKKKKTIRLVVFAN